MVRWVLAHARISYDRLGHHMRFRRYGFGYRQRSHSLHFGFGVVAYGKHMVVLHIGKRPHTNHPTLSIPRYRFTLGRHL